MGRTRSYAPTGARLLSTEPAVRLLVKTTSCISELQVAVATATRSTATSNTSSTTLTSASSVVVGDLVFLSGMSGRTMETGDVSSNDVKAQLLVALDKIRAALDECGSSMNNIVKTVIYLKNVEDYELMRATEWEYYQKYAPELIENPPASTFMQPRSLARPDMLVEIDVVACL
jgi:2-iminobutanoate/2-iminopropanoate deaminase